MQDHDVFDRHVASIFWSVQTITTVGYGTFSLGNSIERLFSMVIIIIGVTIYSFIVGSFSSSVQNEEE
jgi:hypothetical protein